MPRASAALLRKKAGKAGKAGEAPGRRPGPRLKEVVSGKAHGALPHAPSGGMIPRQVGTSPPIPLDSALRRCRFGGLRRAGAGGRRALRLQPQACRRVLSDPPAVADRCFRSAESAGKRKECKSVLGGKEDAAQSVGSARSKVSVCFFLGRQGRAGRPSGSLPSF